MDFKDLKTKPDEVKKIAKNFKEWYDEQQPKKRCDMIAGHDNYWEGKIEEIKKVLDDTDENISAKIKKFNLIGIPYQIIIGQKSEGDLFEFKEIDKESQNLSIDKVVQKLTKEKNSI